MRYNMIRHNKGFTLVELLAVVVILGIIMMISIPAVSKWIDKSKEENIEGQKNTLIMAAQSFSQGNYEVLPKKIGQTTVVTAEELKNENFLKEELRNANDKSCMNSYVEIYKSKKDKYQYTAYVICDGDSIPDEEEDAKPTISISFSGDNRVENNIQDVSVSSFHAVITGGTFNSTDYKLEGYSYSISVKYTSDVNEQELEIYNSGSMSAGGKEIIVLDKDLAEYTDITKVNEFIVTIEAFNEKGGFRKQTASSTYRDTTPPICGKVTGEAEEGSWLNVMGSTRKISVMCSDGDGSGCIKEKYTYTFDEQMDYGTITISDQAGNTTDCRVRVNIDWTFPTLIISAYKRTSSGGREGGVVGTVTMSHSTINNTITLKQYSNTVGGWLNRANYRYGMYYEVQVDDNIAPSVGEWYHNSGKIYNSSASNINDLVLDRTKEFTKEDNKDVFYLSGEGMRRGRYDFRDEAGNKVSIYVRANIDLTNPTCSTSKSHLYYTSGVNVAISCSDGESKCSSSNTTSYSGVKASTSYSVNDVAGNTGSCSVNVSIQQQKRTRSCNSGKRCSAAGCSNYKWDCAEHTSCYMPANSYENCYTNSSCVRKCTSYNSSISLCGCAGYTSWSGWSNVGSCSSSDTVDCQNLYY